MTLIERWTLSECPDCGVLTVATADQIAWCDEHCHSNLTAVEVVRADAYRGAVAENERLKDWLSFIAQSTDDNNIIACVELAEKGQPVEWGR